MEINFLAEAKKQYNILAKLASSFGKTLENDEITRELVEFAFDITFQFSLLQFLQNEDVENEEVRRIFKSCNFANAIDYYNMQTNSKITWAQFNLMDSEEFQILLENFRKSFLPIFSFFADCIANISSYSVNNFLLTATNIFVCLLHLESADNSDLELIYKTQLFIK